MVLQDTTLDKNAQQARTKTTIPQEPAFATSQRAHRIRLEAKRFAESELLQERSHLTESLLIIVPGTRMMKS